MFARMRRPCGAGEGRKALALHSHSRGRAPPSSMYAHIVAVGSIESRQARRSKPDPSGHEVC
jgi:hypothetical protein